jgi:flavin reductase (DIM6/NTAB) family NADH-FMN oxidoreductase RutF
VKDLPQPKVCPFRDPGFGRLAHDHPKSCASGMAISWNTMVAFEPPLVACVVSKPKYSLAALRATEDRRIAILALKRRSRV